MRKLTILSADDLADGIETTKRILNKSILNGSFELYTCEYIKEKGTNCPPETKTLVEILAELSNIDIAFIDIIWEEEFGKTPDGGNYAIELVSIKFPNCLIIPLSNQIGEFVGTMHHPLPNGNTLQAVAKGCTLDKQLEVLYSSLETWQLTRIKKINNTPDWHKLIIALQTDNYNNHITFEGATWLISDFLFPETKLNGEVFFESSKLEHEIKKLVSYPKKGGKKGWGDDDEWGIYTEVYFKFLELDKNAQKRTELEKTAEEIVLNRCKYLNNNQIGLIRKDLSAHQVNSLPELSSIKECRQIPEMYYDNLLVRLASIAICHISTILHKDEWRSQNTLAKLFNADATAGSIKNFIHYLGFKLTKRGGYVDTETFKDELFYTETIYLQRFTNAWLEKHKLL